MLTQRKLGWRLVVRYQAKAEFPFIAYAVHSNGKIERAGARPSLDRAIYAGGDLVRTLNRYHKYAGKYAGTDILVGRNISPKKIEARAKVLTLAIRKLLAESQKIADRIQERKRPQ